MLILSREDVKQVLDITELFEALRHGFRMLAEGQWHVPLRTAIDMSRQEGIALSRKLAKGLHPIEMEAEGLMQALEELATTSSEL